MPRPDNHSLEGTTIRALLSVQGPALPLFQWSTKKNPLTPGAEQLLWEKPPRPPCTFRPNRERCWPRHVDNWIKQRKRKVMPSWVSVVPGLRSAIALILSLRWLDADGWMVLHTGRHCSCHCVIGGFLHPELVLSDLSMGSPAPCHWYPHSPQQRLYDQAENTEIAEFRLIPVCCCCHCITVVRWAARDNCSKASGLLPFYRQDHLLSF